MVRLTKIRSGVRGSISETEIVFTANDSSWTAATASSSSEESPRDCGFVPCKLRFFVDTLVNDGNDLQEEKEKVIISKIHKKIL